MTTLKDAMYNIHPDSGTENEYAQGLFVGVVATIMQLKACEFDTALRFLVKYDYFPAFVDMDKVPETWRADVERVLE